jgi:hypothetical protein
MAMPMVLGAITTMSIKLIHPLLLPALLAFLAPQGLASSGQDEAAKESLLESQEGAVPRSVGYPVLDPQSGQVLAQVESQTTLWEPASKFARQKKLFYRRVDGKSGQDQDSTRVVETLTQDSKGHLLSYLYLDPLTGERLEVAVEQGKAKILSQSGHKSRSVQMNLPWSSTSLVGAQIADYIRDHWSVLESGKPLPFELFVPFRRGFFGFQAETSRVDRQGRIRVKVVASSWMIRAFAPSIELEYQCQAPGPSGSCPSQSQEMTLVAYKGPSPLEIQGSRHPTVRLDLSHGTSLNP